MRKKRAIIHLSKTHKTVWCSLFTVLLFLFKWALIMVIITGVDASSLGLLYARLQTHTHTHTHTHTCKMRLIPLISPSNHVYCLLSAEIQTDGLIRSKPACSHTLTRARSHTLSQRSRENARDTVITLMQVVTIATPDCWGGGFSTELSI